MYKRMYEEVMVLVACWYPIHSSFRSGLGILKICALSVSLTALCHQKKGGIRPTTSKEDETNGDDRQWAHKDRPNIQ